ncbi:prepilin-type N-terminal cleavage/methylation domain-containing protein [Oribacterium sp. P9]|uniref:prepilin-type N-terminal cleavage/methylation domain-containing protein n=1 Tax=Oribacterium sp. P9 TaxID=3378068 RepID=UPI003966A4DD
MTNAIKKRLDRKGFTLAEVLVTVAILLILAGVTFVSVVQYQKNLRLMEMDGTAKEIFIAAQNHLSVAKASGDLDRLAEKAKSATDTTDSTIGTKLDPSLVSAYAGDTTSGEYYYVIHNVTSGIESCTPSGSGAILQMMLPFGALDETVATGGNYAIVYELKSASVVAVLYSGAGNASFGNAAVVNFGDDDVKALPTLYNDKSARKSYQKGGVTAIVGCYTGTAGSAAIPTETLEAPKLEVKNENKLHVIVSDTDKTAGTDNVTLIIRGVQSGTVAQRILERSRHTGTGTFDVTLDDITGDDGSYRFVNIILSGRFKPTTGTAFIPGENIEISARVSSTTGFATPKESAKYTVSSLFGDVNETKDAGNTTVYIRNLRHLENLGANVSGFTATLGNGTTSGSSKVVNITAEQKNDITMFSMSTSGSAGGNHFENLRGSAIYGMGQEATFAAIDVNYPLVYHGNQHEIHDVSIGAQQDHTAAGIFGQVADPASGAANASLSVSDLILRNNRVSGTNVKNAGMLVGETAKNLTVDGVLAYYHEDTYDETKDSSVEVTASENAGGLIGLVSGGKLDVKNSAAAVYVKGGSAAGGFIGSVSGASADSTIVQSYAGGHTRDGAYSTTDATTNKPVLEGPGRYNVQASGNAGGFIGVTTNQVQMDNVYATTSVYSSSYSDSNKCSGSFAGTGTLSIPAKTEKDGSTKKYYYALGPHNGVDATKEELVCAELAQGQAHRQATPYDRKLVLKNKETVHPKMDKTSYPLCTVRNLCEEDASVNDTDLPWFIKEHVGDWVVQKAGEAGFEVDNGNRLLVNIDTGIEKIQDDTYYELKVHGNSSKQDAYFLIYINKNNSVTVRRSVNEAKVYEWNPVVSEVCTLKTSKNNGSKSLILEFCLDDITKNGGNFLNVCTNSLWPGEDITLNVAPAKCIHIQYQNPYWVAEFDAKNEQLTNSIYGSSVPSSLNKNDEHNNRKIDAVHKVNTALAMKDNSWGLIPGASDGGFYAQIDNSRHLQNLTSEVSGETSGFKIKITGAIQTDNIYWTGDILNKDAFTMSIQEELHPENSSDIAIWGNGRQLTTDSCFKPFAYFDGLKYYNGSDFKISGLKVNETGDQIAAGLFAQRGNELTIKNLTMENASITSQKFKAGVLIGYAQGKTVIDNVHITGKTIVQGKEESGGLIGRLENEANITNSNIDNITVISKEINGNDGNYAGGLVGYSKNSSFTIRNVSVASQNTEVIAAKNAGGLIGYMEGCGGLTLDTVNVTAFVTSDSTEDKGGAGGFFGYIAGLGAKPVIKDCQYYGAGIKEQKNSLTQKLYTANINAKKSAGGIIGYAACNVELENFAPVNTIIASSEGYAGGLVGSSEYVTIKVNDKENQSNKVNDSVKLYKMIVAGNEAAGGIIGNAGKDAVIKNVNLEQVKITSSVSYAGGLIGNVEQYIPITIDQITLDQCEITGSQATGGFIGRVSNATVTIENSNVQNSSTIKSMQSVVGGLIGYTNQITNITDTSIKESNITGYGCTGGFIGQYDQSNDLNRTVTVRDSNVRESMITSTNDKVGGFIGRADGSIKVDRGVVENTQITGTENSAGGLAGITAGNTDLQNVKVIGKNTIIDGRNESGGLIGVCGTFDNVDISIKNAAVSAPIQSRGMHAGGFIGAMQATGYSYTKPVTISNSYYAGRTQNGSYVLKKSFDVSNPDQMSDYANIMGAISAGGFVGSTMDVNINFMYCFSTGSVLAGYQAGGIIGYARNIGTQITVNNCYSMGHVAGTISGGYIGEIDSSNKVTFNSAYYLNCFNDQNTNIIGKEPSNPKTANIINTPERILGSADSSDLTTADHTYNYDETLNGHAYPYKNWTTDWEVEGNPITYYGDWPSVSLDGKFMYFKRTKRDNDYSAEAEFTCYDGYTFIGHMSRSNVKIESKGFGLITTLTDRNAVNSVFSFSTDGKNYQSFTAEGNNNDPMEGAILHYWGRDYYVYRFTNLKLDDLKNGNAVFIKNSLGTTYKITNVNEKVTFELVS